MRGSPKALVAGAGSSMLVIAVLAPILAMTMIAESRAGALAPTAGNDWLLIALAFGGAAASVLNGLGRSVKAGKVASSRTR